MGGFVQLGARGRDHKGKEKEDEILSAGSRNPQMSYMRGTLPIHETSIIAFFGIQYC